MPSRLFAGLLACMIAVAPVAAQPSPSGPSPAPAPLLLDRSQSLSPPPPQRPWVEAPPDPMPVDLPAGGGDLFGERFSLRLALLLGWMDRSPIPSGWTVPATGATATLAGGRRAEPVRAGFLMDGVWWVDRGQTLGVDAGFLTLDDWFNRRDPQLVYTPVAGYHAATADVFSRYSSADVNARLQLYAVENFRVEGLLGFRYAGLHERGWLDSVTPDQDVGIVEYMDRATARNDFYGGQVGLATRWQSGRWAFEATGKVALGGVRERADLSGDSANALLAGGAALPSLSRTQFAVQPSVSATLSRRVWGNTRVFVGYDFQYLSRAVRASEVFDAVANPNGQRLTGDGSFWMQGIRLGCEWRF